MAHPQHPIYGNPDRRGFFQPFTIYPCVSQDTLTSILSELEDSEDLQVSPRRFPRGTPAPEIVAYHRAQCHTADPAAHPLLIVVADREDFHQHGVLLAHLDVYCDPSWKVGYVRHPASGPLPLASISVGQTDWDEVLGNAEFGLQWDRYFAKYPTGRSFTENRYDGGDDGGDNGGDASREQRFWDMDAEFRKALEGPERQRFQPFPARGEDGELLRGDDLEEVARVHAGVAASDAEFHESLCLWFDGDAWEACGEVTVVKLGEAGLPPASRTLPIADAANLLVDIAMGIREW